MLSVGKAATLPAQATPVQMVTQPWHLLQPLKSSPVAMQMVLTRAQTVALLVPTQLQKHPHRPMTPSMVTSQHRHLQECPRRTMVQVMPVVQSPMWRKAGATKSCKIPLNHSPLPGCSK